MPHINLLPWREELRRRRQKDFGIRMAMTVVAMLGIVALVHIRYSNKIEFQGQRNDYLKEETNKLDQKIEEIRKLDQEREHLVARMEIIQELQARRPEIVHLFDELVKTLPDGVYYNKLIQQGRTLTVEGIAQSNARVSSLMRNLDGSDWLTKPSLIQIKADNKASPDEIRLSSFSLKFQQTDPRKDDKAKSDKAKKDKAKSKRSK